MRARGMARDTARRWQAVPAGSGPYSPYGLQGYAPAPVAAQITAQVSGVVGAQAKAVAKARGKAAARAVAEYESFATSLAFLRRQARRGTAGPDLAERELELLHHLWQRREVAGPALAYAAQATGRLRPRHVRPAHGPYGNGPGAYPGHGPYQPYGSPAPHQGPAPYGQQPYPAYPYGEQPYNPQPYNQQPYNPPQYGQQPYGGGPQSSS